MIEISEDSVDYLLIEYSLFRKEIYQQMIKSNIKLLQISLLGNKDFELGCKETEMGLYQL